jgi:hypothetical protein
MSVVIILDPGRANSTPGRVVRDGAALFSALGGTALFSALGGTAAGTRLHAIAAVPFKAPAAFAMRRWRALLLHISIAFCFLLLFLIVFLPQ